MENNNTENNCELRIEHCELALPSAAPKAHYTVYKLTDPDGKVYIGCTGKRVEERWKKGWHYNYHSRIYKAIREFGWENFEKKILCEKLTREGAEKLEKWFIAYYDSATPEKGYNRALGGLGKGSRMSDATKALSRQVKCSMYQNDPDYRERVKKGIRSSHENNPEYREKLSLSLKKYYAENPEKKEEIRRRMSEYLSKPENRAFVESDTRAKPVICVETGVIYPSQLAAERATGYHGIHHVCHGQRMTAGGYHWRNVHDSRALNENRPEESGR